MNHQTIDVDVFTLLHRRIHHPTIGDGGQRGIFHATPHETMNYDVAIARPHIRNARVFTQPTNGKSRRAKHG